MALTLLLEVLLIHFCCPEDLNLQCIRFVANLSVDSLASAVYGDATFSFINMFVVKKKEK